LEQVSNSLVASQKDREFREQQELLTQAAQQTDQLSEVLYKNGGASYLQVLTSETNYFSAELNLVQAQLNERLALVQLYQSSEEGGSNSEKEVSNENKDVFIASSPGYCGTGALAAADEAETRLTVEVISVLVSPFEDPAVTNVLTNTAIVPD